MPFASSPRGDGLFSTATPKISTVYSNHRRQRSNTHGGDLNFDIYRTAYHSGPRVYPDHSGVDKRYSLSNSPEHTYPSPSNTAHNSPYGSSPTRVSPIPMPKGKFGRNVTFATEDTRHSYDPLGSSLPTTMHHSQSPVLGHNNHGHHHPSPHHQRNSSSPMAGFPNVPISSNTAVSHGNGLQRAASLKVHHHHHHEYARNNPHGSYGTASELERQQLLKWFRSVDKDRDGHLTAEELQSVLLNGDWSKFNMETVYLLLSLFDQDGSGTLTFPEFENMWRYINEWRACFSKFDVEQSGTIRPSQFKRALKSFGYGLDDHLVALTIQRFDCGRGKREISIDNFIQACVTIKGTKDAFDYLRPDHEGRIHITYPQLVRLVMNDRSLYRKHR
ncbi:hypothetical protein IWQ61_007211 [Dispira simplex]|nr:hypothetical protein IWQ61_007211 [Dispira simplex]